MPPMAWPSECSAPQSEMFIARPARRLAHAMSERAPWSEPSRTARHERAAGEPRRLERDPVAHRRRGPDDDRGDRLCERVDPRHRGDPGRKPPGEDGVDERVLGAQERACDAGLGVGRVVGDDRAARDLRAGAGGRRHAHERDRGRRVGHLAAREAQVPLALAGDEPGGLGGVHRRSAADRDDGVAAGVREPGRGLLDERRRSARRAPSRTARRRPAERSRRPPPATRPSRPSSITISGRVAPSSASTAARSAATPSPNRILTGRWFRNGATVIRRLPAVRRCHRRRTRPGSRTSA